MKGTTNKLKHVPQYAVQLKFGISNLVLDGLMLKYAPPKPTAEYIRSCQ
jgi:hypothetical protein